MDSPAKSGQKRISVLSTRHRMPLVEIFQIQAAVRRHMFAEFRRRAPVRP